jgi:hypothetical protein
MAASTQLLLPPLEQNGWGRWKVTKGHLCQKSKKIPASQQGHGHLAVAISTIFGMRSWAVVYGWARVKAANLAMLPHNG